MHSGPAVDLWLASLDDADTVSAHDLSDADDRRRYDQIVVPRRKRQFAFRRLALRYVLGRYLPPHYSLEHEPTGRPYVRTAQGRTAPQFSTSASRDICAVCVSDVANAVGIDVEISPPAIDIAGIVARFLPDARSATQLPQHPSDPAGAAPALEAFRQHAAVLSWCRLEASIKLHRRTLHRTLFRSRDPFRATDRDDHHVVVAGAGYVCAVAQEQPFRIACFHRIDYSTIAREC